MRRIVEMMNKLFVLVYDLLLNFKTKPLVCCKFNIIFSIFQLISIILTNIYVYI